MKRSRLTRKQRLDKLRLKKPWLFSGDVNTMRQLESGWKPFDYGKYKHKHDAQ